MSFTGIKVDEIHSRLKVKIKNFVDSFGWVFANVEGASGMWYDTPNCLKSV